MGKIIALIVIIGLVFIYFNRQGANKEAALKNIQLGEQFLADNKSVVDIIETDSGLQYQVLTKGTGEEHPSASSKVKVHYHGTLMNGTVFDSSVERNQPISFGLNQVISGWTEGVQLMVVGDKFRFYIPAKLGYGDRAAGAIPPGSLLIFDVELLAIES